MHRNREQRLARCELEEEFNWHSPTSPRSKVTAEMEALGFPSKTVEGGAEKEGTGNHAGNTCHKQEQRLRGAVHQRVDLSFQFQDEDSFYLIHQRKKCHMADSIEGLLERLRQLLPLSRVWYTAVWRTLVIWMLYCLISFLAVKTRLTGMDCKNAWISV